jgi:hypothetical protein
VLHLSKIYSMYKVIRVDQEYDAIIKDLLQRSGIKTEKEYTEKMFDFFKNSGLDPTNEVKTVSGEISKLRNVVVGFIREQEKKKLNPLIQQVQELAEGMLSYMKDEAVTKEDLKQFISNMKPDSVKNQISEPGKAHELFQEFISKMNQSLKGFSIDKKTVKHYENLFKAIS